MCLQDDIRAALAAERAARPGAAPQVAASTSTDKYPAPSASAAPGTILTSTMPPKALETPLASPDDSVTALPQTKPAHPASKTEGHAASTPSPDATGNVASETASGGPTSEAKSQMHAASIPPAMSMGSNSATQVQGHVSSISSADAPAAVPSGSLQPDPGQAGSPAGGTGASALSLIPRMVKSAPTPLLRPHDCGQAAGTDIPAGKSEPDMAAGNVPADEQSNYHPAIAADAESSLAEQAASVPQPKASSGGWRKSSSSAPGIMLRVDDIPAVSRLGQPVALPCSA